MSPSDTQTRSQEDAVAPAPAKSAATEHISAEQISALLAHFYKSNIHPVFLFGTNDTGKSLMLLSLLKYAKSGTSECGHRLVKEALPPNFPLREAREEQARRFYELDLATFESGMIPARTDLDNPFFITVDVTQGETTRRLAFLELMGEWFEQDGGDNPRYKPFRQEIDIILQGFSRPMSVIFVGPCVGTVESQFALSHDCLRNCIMQYNAKRHYRGIDNVLYLASKWDMLEDPERPASNFASASPAAVAARLSEHPRSVSWRDFAHADANGAARAKFLLPYSAGKLNGQLVLDPGRNKPVFDHFNRVLWNWLWGNAWEGEDGASAPRRELFPDAALPRPQAPSLAHKAVELAVRLGGGLGRSR